MLGLIAAQACRRRQVALHRRRFEGGEGVKADLAAMGERAVGRGRKVRGEESETLKVGPCMFGVFGVWFW